MATIRTATPKDLGRVCEIVSAATARMNAEGIHQWDEVYPNRADFQADIAEGQLFVIECDGIVAGLITLNEIQPGKYRDVTWFYLGRVLVAHRLAIDPSYQGRGLSSQLMAFAEEQAAAGGYVAIRLDAFTENPAAVALYEKCGYRKVGIVHFRKGPFYCYEKPIG